MGESIFHHFCYSSLQNELCVTKLDYVGVFFSDNGKEKGNQGSIALISVLEWLNRKYFLGVNISMGEPQRKRDEIGFKIKGDERKLGCFGCQKCI